MSLRILPFRQYSEEDVVNLYRLKDGGELAATTDSGMVARVAVNHVATTRAHWGEVADVEGSMALNTTVHVAVDWLLSGVMTASVMEPSLIELVGSNLT